MVNSLFCSSLSIRELKVSSIAIPEKLKNTNFTNQISSKTISGDKLSCPNATHQSSIPLLLSFQNYTIHKTIYSEFFEKTHSFIETVQQEQKSFIYAPVIVNRNSFQISIGIHRGSEFGTSIDCCSTKFLLNPKKLQHRSIGISVVTTIYHI